VFIIGLVLRTTSAAGGGESWEILPGLFQLIVLWPGIAVLIKRIHDRNKSGALVWALYGPMIPATILVIAAIAVAGASGDRSVAAGLFAVSAVLWIVAALVGIWFFVEFGCMRGTIGANRFGPDPVGQR
jgi:uncharacterized membrane protein YhaH (DUF805 family)